MDQIYHILKNVNPIYFILFFLFFLLGWLMRKIYKLFMFLRVILFGKLGEKEARNLLIKNGYEILEEQLTLKGKLLENKKMRFFFIKPDFLVKKNNIIYIAEVKTGKSASIKDRNTRRQLLEYATNLKSNKALLIDINKKNISYVEFL